MWRSQLFCFHLSRLVLSALLCCQFPVTARAASLDQTRTSAEHGDPEAQILLGIEYSLGKLVPQDHVEAARWYRKAADQGDSWAQDYLGGLFENGRGVKRDLVQAYMWHALAAAQGKTEAERNREFVANQMTQSQINDAQRLASAFKVKSTGRISKVEALRAKAEKGDPKAQLALSEHYFNGNGIVEDDVEGLKWLLKAADQGFSPALLALGTRYLDGDGVARDPRQALKWYQTLADRGEAWVNAKSELCTSVVGVFQRMKLRR